MTESLDAIVLGGGSNGLVAAAYLARAGKRVLVLERRPVLGGAATTEEFFPGFKVSTCAHLVGLLLPRIVRDLELEKHGLEILRPDVSLFLPLENGDGLTLWRSAQKTLAEIRRRSPRDAERYPRFEALVSRLTGFLRPLLTKAPPAPAGGTADLLSLVGLGWGLRRLGARTMHQALRILPMSVADFLGEWFETEALKASLGAQGLAGTFVGPRSPGTAALFLIHRLGNWGLPRGGMGGVASALEAAARQHGAEIRTSAPVARVSVREGRASGVVLESGEEIGAKVVLSSADPRTTFTRLIDPALLPPEFLNHVRHIKYRGAVAKVNLALDALPRFPQVEGIIQIGPTLDYIERAFDDAKHGGFSKHPLLEVVLPSVLDPSLTPAGKHVASILVQFAPYHLREGTWNERRDALGDAVIRALSEHAPDLESKILHRQVLTPRDLESTYGLPEGNIHHGEHSLDQLFFMRPVPGGARYGTPLENLYLCGAGAHPGGGVSGAPGFNAARQVLANYRPR